MLQSKRHAILFANPLSGRGRQWLWRIIEQCRRRDIVITSAHFDISESYVQRVLRSAEGAGVPIVLVAGGDGTVGTIARHLVDTPFTLGVLPAGTYNDFARSLDIPMNVAGAVGVVAGGLTAKVDVGRAGERVFAEAAGIGMNTDFARRAQRLRHWLGRLSYAFAALDAYRTRQRFAVTLRVDGKEERFNAFEVAFVNAPAYAGPLNLSLGEANLTSGELRVVVVEDMTWRTILHAVPRSFLHRTLAMPGIDAFSIRAAHVETAVPMPMTLDGEIAATTPISVTVIPTVLSVFVPSSFLATSHATALRR